MQKATSRRFPLVFIVGLVLSCILLTPMAPMIYASLWALWRLTLRWHEKNS
jgi:hypothetical protein